MGVLGVCFKQNEINVEKKLPKLQPRSNVVVYTHERFLISGRSTYDT